MLNTLIFMLKKEILISTYDVDENKKIQKLAVEYKEENENEHTIEAPKLDEKTLYITGDSYKKLKEKKGAQMHLVSIFNSKNNNIEFVDYETLKQTIKGFNNGPMARMSKKLSSMISRKSEYNRLNNENVNTEQDLSSSNNGEFGKCKKRKAKKYKKRSKK